MLFWTETDNGGQKIFLQFFTRRNERMDIAKKLKEKNQIIYLAQMALALSIWQIERSGESTNKIILCRKNYEDVTVIMETCQTSQQD